MRNKDFLPNNTCKINISSKIPAYSLLKRLKESIYSIWKFCEACPFRNKNSCKGYDHNHYCSSPCELLDIFYQYKFKFPFPPKMFIWKKGDKK